MYWKLFAQWFQHNLAIYDINCYPYISFYIILLFLFCQHKLTDRPLLPEPVPAKYKCLMD